MNTLGIRIKLIRGTETQESFAAKIGVSKGSLGGYERDENSPSAEAVLKICAGANISVEWLMTGRGPMRPGEAVPTAQDSAPAPQAAPKALIVAQESTLARCTKLEARLDEVERERRELTAENRQMTAENRHLWKENGELREKCARLEERQVKLVLGHGSNEAVGNAG